MSITSMRLVLALGITVVNNNNDYANAIANQVTKRNNAHETHHDRNSNVYKREACHS